MTSPWMIALYFAVAVVEAISAYISAKQKKAGRAAMCGFLAGAWLVLGLVRLFP